MCVCAQLHTLLFLRTFPRNFWFKNDVLQSLNSIACHKRENVRGTEIERERQTDRDRAERYRINGIGNFIHLPIFPLTYGTNYSCHQHLVVIRKFRRQFFSCFSFSLSFYPPPPPLFLFLLVLCLFFPFSLSLSLFISLPFVSSMNNLATSIRFDPISLPPLLTISSENWRIHWKVLTLCYWALSSVSLITPYIHTHTHTYSNKYIFENATKPISKRSS